MCLQMYVANDKMEKKKWKVNAGTSSVEVIKHVKVIVSKHICTYIRRRRSNTECL